MDERRAQSPMTRHSSRESEAKALGVVARHSMESRALSDTVTRHRVRRSRASRRGTYRY